MANTQPNTIRAKSRVDALTGCTLRGSSGCLAQINAELSTPPLYLLTVKLKKDQHCHLWLKD